ncbi:MULTISPECIES: crotonase/enoyl-CoA hydratase family protein [Pseudovibrio]|uniref:crotonase/enoyl-CoA hydratase family protein n=1 Tax=Stappiaceae TaxID=2821832 RepID=UPI00236653F2|nr:MULTISPECIES: crotonase/enoyl-CoA hydratase family protein [Pseudovibrio]MDD7911186.1 crotonase/enoyl-CoA hydratase family protein [Pseudovibrio exalbescens]MDX5593127.1 crotonase/enoyl-CoA hydratase family protein [Pseudovibrio sp. SPO723]
MITIEMKGAVQVIRMDRAEKKNAITSDMYKGITEALSRDDDTVGCNLILGVPGAFSSGNDIGDFMKFAMGGEVGGWVAEFLKVLPNLPKPTIAGVDGLAVGVGTTMLMHCDMVVASTQATFKTPFVNLGLVPEAGSTLLAPAIMGHQRAFELLCLGEKFDAERAREAGLVNKVVSPEDLETEALELATRISQMPAEAMKLSRDLVRGNRAPLEARIAEEIGLFGERLRSEEAKQAFIAFMQK